MLNVYGSTVAAWALHRAKCLMVQAVQLLDLVSRVECGCVARKGVANRVAQFHKSLLSAIVGSDSYNNC